MPTLYVLKEGRRAEEKDAHDLQYKLDRGRCRDVLPFDAILVKEWGSSNLGAQPSSHLPSSGTEGTRNAPAELFSLDDGSICRNILLCQKARSSEEAQYWALLTPKKADLLGRLMRHDLLCRRFHRVRTLPGLWPGMNIGVLDKLLALSCDEELLNYLDLMRKQWVVEILGGAQGLAKHVDWITVSQLELLAPGTSAHDREVVADLMSAADGLFPSITDAATRRQIGANLQKTTGMILSMRTFFEDIKYLRPCAKILQVVFPGRGSRHNRWYDDKTPDTLCERMRRSFTGGQDQERFVNGTRALWLFAGAHLVDGSGETPRKERNRKTPTARVPTEDMWRRLAAFARELGFNNSEIEKRTPSDRTPAEPLPLSREPRWFSSGQGEARSRRCGRVFERAYEDTKQHLDLGIYRQRPRRVEGGLSCLHVRMLVFSAFLEGKRASRGSSDVVQASSTVTAAAFAAEYQQLVASTSLPLATTSDAADLPVRSQDPSTAIVARMSPSDSQPRSPPHRGPMARTPPQQGPSHPVPKRRAEDEGGGRRVVKTQVGQDVTGQPNAGFSMNLYQEAKDGPPYFIGGCHTEHELQMILDKLMTICQDALPGPLMLRLFDGKHRSHVPSARNLFFSHPGDSGQRELVIGFDSRHPEWDKGYVRLIWAGIEDGEVRLQFFSFKEFPLQWDEV